MCEVHAAHFARHGKRFAAFGARPARANKHGEVGSGRRHLAEIERQRLFRCFVVHGHETTSSNTTRQRMHLLKLKICILKKKQF